MIRPILLYPDPRLALVADPVEVFGDELRVLADDMFETMYDAPGRGLAAPQVGVGLRVFVMDATWKTGAPTPMVFVNPVVTPIGTDTVVHEEGCLSIPDTPRRVSRPARVHVTWQDLDGAAHEAEFSGFESACIQHEADHLDGRLILDHPHVEPEAP
ncbi:MAG: peptide deformylase [Pseudomonadota bacterium]